MSPRLLSNSLLALICSLPVFPHVLASEAQCVAASEIVANSGRVSGSWSDAGVARNNIFDCSGDSCSYTGEIPEWVCSSPAHRYAGPETGFEYTYSFTAPGTGVCTFIEYQEGFRDAGSLSGVVDWFLVVYKHDSACGPSNCIDYIWENVSDPICGSGIRDVCSFKSFQVTEGQRFFIVADIFSGLTTVNPTAYPFGETWTVEMKCDIEGQEIFIDGFEAETKRVKAVPH